MSVIVWWRAPMRRCGPWQNGRMPCTRRSTARINHTWHSVASERQLCEGLIGGHLPINSPEAKRTAPRWSRPFFSFALGASLYFEPGWRSASRRKPIPLRVPVTNRAISDAGAFAGSAAAPPSSAAGSGSAVSGRVVPPPQPGARRSPVHGYGCSRRSGTGSRGPRCP